ncbi:hypothetical protein [Bacillus sp. CRN 9]|uniref:hypothetical protein n=1 Tax=Cytobacillus horneckiae TaxID=549687 RepID=UPI002AA5DCD7
MQYYYRSPYPGEERFFPFLVAPFVGGFLGGLAGGALAAPFFFRPRPCGFGPCPPFGPGFGPYGPYGPTPYGPGQAQFGAGAPFNPGPYGNTLININNDVY